MRRSRGLVLLIALGMLGLFALLAVTYVVAAGSSRSGSIAMKLRANNQNTTVTDATSKVLQQVIRGTRDHESALYKHSLLDDILDSSYVRTRFGHKRLNIDAVRPNWCTQFSGVSNGLVKLSLDPRDPLDYLAIDKPILSDFENAYNSRVLTVLEGPLAGNSFRILKYVGYIPGPADNLATHPDLNFPGVTPNPALSDPSNALYAYDYDYSVMIDVMEAGTNKLTGNWFNAQTGETENLTASIQDWINLPNGAGLSNLFYFYNPTAANRYQGYACLINGATFSNAAVGINDVPLTPGFSNVDGRSVMKIPTNNARKVPPALLPNYDYLHDLNYMNNGVTEIGPRSALSVDALIGGTNEGYDVADFRDFWLASQANNIPSFHRPELIHYIANLFGAPNSLSAAEITELLRLLDASTARVMSYTPPTVATDLPVNPNFQPTAGAPQLPAGFTTADLQAYVLKMIVGPWDVDNDNDGKPDSVWSNFNLPTTYSPSGKLLKPLGAILIEDLDSRVNLNIHGDRFQGLSGYDAFSSNVGLTRTVGSMLPQGFGFGPADISLTPLLSSNPDLLRNSFAYPPNDFRRFTVFDDRYGARNYRKFPIDISLNDQYLDRVPGRRSDATFDGNDYAGQLTERETKHASFHGRLPGAPSGRRSGAAAAFDRNGNIAFVNPSLPDGNPDAPLASSAASETIDDPYESSGGASSISDTPFTLAELETVLRRFDDDSNHLPDRIKSRLNQLPGFSNVAEINRLITTLSAELRHPNISASAVMPNGSLETQAGNFLGLIKLLHEQRFRRRSLPSLATDESPLSISALYELFPSEFAGGMKMDLNRPLGNGVDEDNDGQVDEPQELASGLQLELRANTALSPVVNFSASAGVYSRELNLFNSTSRTYFGSRQVLARHLYCLAQLLIPRDYKFPSMQNETAPVNGVGGTFKWYQLRAAAIAQWAVNVVDFRDADAACTRFEYDIMPFGNNDSAVGPPVAPTTRAAFWAPDRVGADPSFRPYVGVVWGMEAPELLITESLNFHNKSLRDTDMDPNNKSTTDPMNPDPDLDQFRFPQGSSFLEVFAPRTTISNVNSDGLPGIPSSIYKQNVSGNVGVDVARLAPNSGNEFGRQPIYRIAISTAYTSANSTTHPNYKLQKDTNTFKAMHSLTHQSSDNRLPGTTIGNAVAAGTTTGLAEERVGSGLYEDLASVTLNPVPKKFDRIVWFSNVSASTVGRVPDLLDTDNDATQPQRAHRVYYNRTDYSAGNLASDNGPILPGGSYMVVGPRITTDIGSTAYVPFTATPTTTAWPSQVVKTAINSAPYPFLRSPSPQGIKLNVSGSGVSTTLLNGDTITDTQPNWVSKSAIGMVCAAVPPVESPLPAVREQWNYCFENGVGLNISMPRPQLNHGYWKNTKKPLWRLNSNDTRGTRFDNSLGFGDSTVGTFFTAPDSYYDTATATGEDPSGVFPSASGSRAFPDTPFDYDPTLSPEIAGNGMANDGTYENVRVAYLQRLADPEMGYDPINNPYLTVDWISMDLTVFNGEAPQTGTGSEASAPPSGPAAATTPSGLAFQSRYKDGDRADNNANRGGSFASAQPTAPTTKTAGVSYHSFSTAQLRSTPVFPSVPTKVTPIADGRLQPRPAYFMRQLGYASPQTTAANHSSATTLGYANVGYRNASLTTTLADTASNFDGFGPPLSQAANTLYDGYTRDLTSVVWFNRPYSTINELMLVPFSGPGQFGMYHGKASTVVADARKPFNFLPSFQTATASKNDSIGPGGDWMKRDSTATTVEADWPLLLEFLETQPLFADSKRVYDPDTLLGSAVSDVFANRFLNSYYPANYTGSSEPNMVRGPSLLAPFNNVPTFINHGKINFNTIAQQAGGGSVAFQALEHNYLVGTQRSNSQDALLNSWIENRRGYSTASVPPSSFFSAVVPGLHPDFPTQFAGAYRPSTTANIAPVVSSPAILAQMRSKFSVETTFERSLLPNQNVNAMTPSSMMFSPDAVIMNELTGAALTAYTTAGGSYSAEELEDAKRQPFVRSQRAMRLPNIATNQSNVFAIWVTVSLFEYDPVSGFGKEYVDPQTGLNKRERAFFIVDRTVPVGFVPGEDLNADKMVLLRRKLSGN